MFKKIILAAALVATSASVATAGNTISNFVGHQHDAGQVQLGTVTAEGPGVVSIYSYLSGEQGVLLGTEAVHAGANMDVMIEVPNGESHVIAVLEVSGAIADTQEVFID